MEAPLALYRRYRPETFAEVIGQDHVTAPLRNALSNNRVNHAYLFSGPRGCGKTTSARILARAINCEKGPIAEPCGVCKSCTDLARGGPGSIDVIEIDAASHGGVDDARDLRERAFFAPVESRYKIYIIDEAHMVTTQGFNALLKLVEEPPPHLKFIFATTEPDKVIGTIRSRTHHYPFRLVPPKVLGDYMASLCEAEGVAIEPAALPLVVRAGAGSVRDSLSVLDQLIGGAGPDGVTYELAVALLGFTPDSLLDACVDGFAAHDSKAVFETIEKVIETGQDPKRFAEDLLRRLRDLVVLSAVPNAVHSGLIEAAEDQGERLQTQAAGIGPAELTRAADIVAAGLLEMRGATAPRLQLELICAKVLLPGADDSTNGIQARLDRMERRLTIGVPTPDPTHPNPDPATSRAAARAAAGGPPAAGAAPTADPATAGGPTGTASAADPGAVSTASAADPGSEGTMHPGGAATPATAGVEPSAGARVGTGAPTTPGGSTAPNESRAAGSTPAGAVPGRGSAGAAHDASRTGTAADRAGLDASRSGAWSDESTGSTPSTSQPATSAPAASQAANPAASAGPTSGVPGSTATGASAAPSAGSVGLADIRRLWPEVLEAVKAKRRFAWIMLSQNAQVIAIDDQTLTLGLVNAGARESFARSGSDEILRQAMIDTIGLNRRIEAVVDPSTDPGAGGPGGQRPSTPPGSSPTSGTSSGPGDPSGGASGGGAPGGTEAPGAPGTGAADGSAGAPGNSGGGAPGGGSGAAGGSPVGSAGVAGSASDTGGWGAGGSDAASGAHVGVAGRSGPRGTGAAGSDGAGAGGPREPDEAGSAGDSGAGGGPGAAGAGASAGTSAAGAGGAGAGGTASMGAVGAGGAGAGRSGAGGSGAGGSTAGPAGSYSQDGGGLRPDGPGTSIALQEPPDSEYDVPPEHDPWEAGPTARAGQPTGRGTQPGSPPADQPTNPAIGRGRREQAGSKRRAAEAAVAAEQARRAAAAPAAPEVPLTPEEEADAIGEDDQVLEEDSRTHTDLLRETLGAQIITEEPN
ncbi:DNA polymerase III subunit gamma and tau [Kribbella sp. CA-247076]|uniref:DNA polymerase III subunit gamma and tau n=1 Tax=Kribbella sp. CA-247076 TaxID=3239941 RepID=UPI003D8A1A91